ncbi:hypothetical protein [Castellaniella sp.]|uniref:hypothetical protein n=1 Tax=Castellaniella sp. TaxID=1955812 RepID=UPI002AFEA5A5|nr:hypothetical protein [Castellaniella sp.]
MNPLEALSSALHPVTRSASPEGRAVSGVTQLEPPSWFQDSISDLGRALSRTAQARGTDRDIEDSDLPDAVKSLLRMIRDLRRMLDRLMQELQQVQADEVMSADTKRSRLLQLQAQISAANGALIGATQKLASMLRDMKLDQAQQMTAGQLAL